MGRADDDFLAHGADVAAEFNKVATCDSHSTYASVEFKSPRDREDPLLDIVLAFSDCNIADRKNFDDVAPAITAWAEDRTSQGSGAGHWVLFPAYGGGGEEFDFK